MHDTNFQSAKYMTAGKFSYKGKAEIADVDMIISYAFIGGMGKYGRYNRRGLKSENAEITT